MPIFTEQPQVPGAAGFALLLSSAVVAGAGLLRPFTPAPNRRLAWVAAGVSGLAAAVGLFWYAASPLVLAVHLGVVLAAVVLLRSRFGGLAGGVALTAVLVAETAIPPSIVDIAMAPGYLVAGILVLGVAFAVGSGAAARRFAPAAVAAVLVAAGLGVAGVPAPPAPPASPGLTAVHLAGEHVGVLVAPNRPGRNLVLLSGITGSASVNGGPATSRPGTAGLWALVDLPAGRGTLRIERGGAHVSLPVDTGRGAPAPPAFTGPDGPECAHAALGAYLAGAQRFAAACPAEALASADAASLRALVGSLAGRSVRTVDLESDGSPRSVAAAAVVRDAAARSGIAVGGSAGALIVVSGWGAAAGLAELAGRQRTEVVYPSGVYLAPWLLAGPVLGATNGAVLPLRFDPRDSAPVRYEIALGGRVPGVTPTAAGFRAWAAALGVPVDGPTRLFAASAVAYLPKEFAMAHGHDTGWLPGGTVVAVTGALP